MSKKTTHSTCAVVAALFVATTSFAGETVKTTKTPVAPEKALVSGTFGVNAVSGYVFRGQLLESNMAYQPNLTLSVPVDLSVLGFDGAAVQLQTTQSINQNAPNAGWFRSEVDLGLTLTKGAFVFAPSYQVFNSPTNKFETAHGVSLKVAVKGENSYGLSPYVRGFFGVEGNANNGTRPGSFYEVGIAPSYKLGQTTFTVPAAIGVGARGYYANNQTYGYTTVGLHSTTSLTSNLNFVAGLDYWNTDKALGNSKQNTVTTSVGLNLTF